VRCVSSTGGDAVDGLSACCGPASVSVSSSSHTSSLELFCFRWTRTSISTIIVDVLVWQLMAQPQSRCDKAAKTEQCKRFSVRKSFPRQWGHAPLIFNPTVSTVAFGLLFCTETGFYAVVTDIILLHKHSRMHQNPILWNIQLRFFVWGRGRAQPIHQTLPGEEREYGLPTSYRSAPGLERPPPQSHHKSSPSTTLQLDHLCWRYSQREATLKVLLRKLKNTACWLNWGW